MTDLIVPSKRPRAPSIADKHHEYSETHAAASASGTSQESEISQAQVTNFLEICRFCKKNLCHGEDIYMYGYFGAFCSKGCRAKQMACDIFTEKSREMAKKKKGRLCETKPKVSKDESLGNREKTTSPHFFV